MKRRRFLTTVGGAAGVAALGGCCTTTKLSGNGTKTRSGKKKRGETPTYGLSSITSADPTTPFTLDVRQPGRQAAWLVPRWRRYWQRTQAVVSGRGGGYKADWRFRDVSGRVRLYRHVEKMDSRLPDFQFAG